MIVRNMLFIIRIRPTATSSPITRRADNVTPLSPAPISVRIPAAIAFPEMSHATVSAVKDSFRS